MNIIIFSKDRPAQLDLFLSSMEKHWPESMLNGVFVVYKSTEKQYDEGYRRCMGYHPNAMFSRQGYDFKMSMLSLIVPTDPHTVFFVDDIVWKARFSMTDREFTLFSADKRTVCLSLRLYPGITYSYAVDHNLRVPTFLSKHLWVWRQAQGDWAYPMSLDGHIFHTDDILPLLNELQYDGPNELEGRLTHRPFPGMFMRCYEESPIVNIPDNKVQSCVPKARCGSGSAKALNDEFLKGKRLRFDQYIGIKNKSVHELLPLEWRS